jgi:histidyl-tRNA synthetase
VTKLSGFPEFLPAERAVEQHVLDHLRRVFELHGFANIETRAVETLETLLRKGEIDKEVYAIRRLQADDDEASVGAPPAGTLDSASGGLALRYDLTVPFARYVLENSNELDFPFRRWQIQKVWRGERPQQGRYREFTQADIDIVGRGSLPFQADVEVAQVMAEALSGLPIPALTLQVSNRKVLEGFALGLGIAEPTAVMPVVDKLDKLSRERVLADLQGVGLSESQADAILDLAAISGGGADVLARVRALGVSHPLLDEGLAELAAVVDGVTATGAHDAGGAGAGVTIVADLRIARGLDYYTGTVFETRMAGYEHLGSICSGGRYDQLAADRRSTYPGVGISLGVSRLLVPLVADGLTASRSVPSVVLVSLADEDARDQAADVARRLRARGIATEVAPKPEKFGKQIQHAEKRGIPFVWFPGDSTVDGSVKDIRTGEQLPADPDHWDPPPADLTPQIQPLPKEKLL